MKMTTGFALILVGLALNACSFSSSDGNQEEQARLESDYHLSESEIAPLKGLWTGTLTRAADGAVVPINVSISSQPLTTGYTASGRAVQRALPTATPGLDERHDLLGQFSGFLFDWQWDPGPDEQQPREGWR